MNERPLLDSEGEWILLFMSNQTVTVDVRDDIRSGREPFSKIMNAVTALGPDERLLLIAPFEPVPLFHAMEKQGFVHHGQATPSGDWEVLFTRRPDAQPTGSTPAEAPVDSHHQVSSMPVQIVEVDARGLEPPQPMVKILEALAATPPDAGLCARTDRRPVHLYSQLEERGFAAETQERPDGTFVTHIRRR